MTKQVIIKVLKVVSYIVTAALGFLSNGVVL